MFFVFFFLNRGNNPSSQKYWGPTRVTIWPWPDLSTCPSALCQIHLYPEFSLPLMSALSSLSFRQYCNLGHARTIAVTSSLMSLPLASFIFLSLLPTPSPVICFYLSYIFMILYLSSWLYICHVSGQSVWSHLCPLEVRLIHFKKIKCKNW